MDTCAPGKLSKASVPSAHISIYLHNFYSNTLCLFWGNFFNGFDFVNIIFSSKMSLHKT